MEFITLLKKVDFVKIEKKLLKYGSFKVKVVTFLIVVMRPIGYLIMNKY